MIFFNLKLQKNALFIFEKIRTHAHSHLKKKTLKQDKTDEMFHT
jgi:hypothetical protein